MARKINKKKLGRSLFILVLLIAALAAAVIYYSGQEEPAAYALPKTLPLRIKSESYGLERVNWKDDEYLILVNKTHPLPQDYWPEDMVQVEYRVTGFGKETGWMRPVASEALSKLIEAADAEGYKIAVRTAFRSYDYQKNLFNSYAAREGEAKANRYSARPGESEHQSGLCCDVSSPSVSWQLSYQYGETAEGKWLYDHAHEFGYIVRYLQEKEDITGYVYEPWHIRYVGVEHATAMWEQNLTLEEYLGELD